MFADIFLVEPLPYFFPDCGIIPLQVFDIGILVGQGNHLDRQPGFRRQQVDGFLLADQPGFGRRLTGSFILAFRTH